MRSIVMRSMGYAVYPKLKGKGAEIKYVVRAIASAWDHFRHDDTYEYETVRQLLSRQCEVQDILSDHSGNLFLPVAAAERFKKVVDDVLRLYTVLANKADGEGLLLWSVVPKHHWLWHLASKSALLNPRAGCCMVDEDYVGQIKHIVASSVTGSTTMKASRTASGRHMPNPVLRRRWKSNKRLPTTTMSSGTTT